MVVAVLTEDNADRISVFNVMRLMLPGSALRSSIVFMFPSELIFVRTLTSCAIDVFTSSDGPMLFIHSKLCPLALVSGRNETFALGRAPVRESPANGGFVEDFQVEVAIYGSPVKPRSVSLLLTNRFPNRTASTAFNSSTAASDFET